MRNARRVALVAAFTIAAACGGGDSTGPSDPTPTAIVVNSGNNQSATVGTAVAIAPAVQVRDKKGRGVPGVQVTFAVATGGGSITGAVDTTDASGIARVGSWTLGTATGANTLAALISGLAPAGFTATAVAGAPAAMVFVTAPGGTAQNGAAFTQQPVLQLRDQFGNNSPTAAVQVTVAVLTGGGTLGGTVTVASNASGVVTFTNLAITGAVGARTLSFTAAGLPALVSGAVQLTAGAAAAVSANSATTLTGTAGAAVTPLPSVLVVDQSGNPVAGATVTFSPAVGEGSVTGGTPLTDASGVATVGSWTLGATSGSNNLTAQVGSLTPVVFTATVNPAAAALLDVVVQPSTGVASGSVLAQQPVVRITDVFGNIIPAAGNTVTATLQGPGATLGGTTSVAAVNGVATFTDLSLTGTAGSYTLAFAASGLTGDVSTAIALGAGPAATIAANAGNGQSATVNTAVATPPSVIVTDLSGNPVAGVAVTFAVTGGGGSATGLTQNTNPAGIATVGSWTLGTAAGSNTLSATSGALGGSPVSFTATGTAAAAAQLLITTQPSATTANGVALAQQPVVRVTDAFGNPVAQAGTVVTVSASSGGTIAAGATATTDAGGIATFSGVILNGAAGSYTLGFSAPGLASATSSSVTLTAGAPALVTITTQPSPTVASGSALAQQPAVQITDAGGNPAPLATSVTASLTGGPPNVTLGGTVTIATGGGGAGAFTDLSLTGVVGGYTLTLSAPGLTAAVSGSIALTAGPAATIAANAGDGQSATVATALPTAPRVLVTDLSGNPVSGVAVTFAVASGGGSGTGLNQVTGADGIATVGSWTLGSTAGANTLTATSGSLGGSPVTFTATGTPAAASQLVLTTAPSASATNGVALAQQPVVRVTDAFGNPVAQLGTIVSVTASAGGTIAAGGTAITDALGVASFSGLVLNGLVGNYTLGFSAAGLSGATSGSIALAAGAPSTLVIATQPSGTVVNGNALAQQPVLQLTDAGGNASPTAGVNITAALTGSPAGVALGGTATVATNGSGVASFTNLTLTGTVGSYSLSFSGASLSTVISTSVALTAGPAMTIAISAGDGQSATVNTAVAVVPSVLVTDQSGNPVSGVVVTFAVASGGGSATGLSPATNAGGIAAVGSWTLGTTAGSNTLTATSGSLTGSPLTFTATGTPAPASQLVLVTPPSASATNGVALAQQPAVQVTDAFGNAVAQPGTTVTVAASSGGTIAAGASAVTGAGGDATFSGVILNGLVGNYTLSFSAPALTGVTSGAIALAAGAPSMMSITTQPSATASNGTQLGQQPVLQLTDAGGNPALMAGVSVTASLTGSPANVALGGTTSVNSNGSGVIGFTNLSLNGLVGTYSLTFSGTGLTSVVSSDIGLAAGAPAGVAAASPVSQAGRVGIAATSLPAVTVTDVSGNPVPNVPVTFQATAGGGTVTGGSPSTDALGQATVGGWTFGRTVTTNTVTATVGALPLVTFDATVEFKVASVASGLDHTCALTIDGVAYCWGANGTGGVGDSSNTQRNSPAGVATSLLFSQIAAGNGYTCAIGAGGAASCWGSNGTGQLGNGGLVPRNAPGTVSGGLQFSDITVGRLTNQHTCGRLSATGLIHCWGGNSSGQFGNNTLAPSLTPVVGGGGVAHTSLSLGDRYTCGIRAGNLAFCWGNNFLGQLGDSTSGNNRVNPVAVKGGQTFTAISSGVVHTCGLTTGGLVYCWGDNSSGGLGQDPTLVTGTTGPILVAGVSSVTQVSVGDGHSCALTSSNQIYCWGLNQNGQLGDGTGGSAGDRRHTPGLVSMPGGLTVTSIASGEEQTCAVTSTNVAYCWGKGDSGQLGDGNGTDSALPVLVANP